VPTLRHPGRFANVSIKVPGFSKSLYDGAANKCVAY
jgi:hypothetical protein